MTGPQGETGPTGASGTFASEQVINSQTGTTYTVLTSDAGKMITLDNSSPITVTVDASTALLIGQSVDMIQLGTGQVTVVFTGSGVVGNGTPGLKFRARYSAASIMTINYDTYILIGDLSA
jgi:hypothetical protein